uniref:Proline-rich protein 36-like n=1 Tax=Elaeis guineensis var. tenera TaxID=51953 RepID=A0A6I9QK36_ELAGV|nr:proline-rich protein 36-like [Elaeis guineensis]
MASFPFRPPLIGLPTTAPSPLPKDYSRRHPLVGQLMTASLVGPPVMAAPPLSDAQTPLPLPSPPTTAALPSLMTACDGIPSSGRLRWPQLPFSLPSPAHLQWLPLPSPMTAREGLPSPIFEPPLPLPDPPVMPTLPSSTTARDGLPSLAHQRWFPLPSPPQRPPVTASPHWPSLPSDLSMLAYPRRPPPLPDDHL